MSKILIIEVDEKISNLERDYLEIYGYTVDICNEGFEGMKKAETEEYALILLGIMLPGINGFSICKKLRQKLNIPIIIVSSRTESADQILGLGLGADDYITKPFDPSVLVARVRANIAMYERCRYKTKDSDKKIKCGPFVLNEKKRKVTLNDTEIYLKNKEYELLTFFIKNRDIVFTKEDLYENIWGMDAEGDTTTVSVHVNRIRQKIEKDPANPKYLLTVWSVGYRFTTG